MGNIEAFEELIKIKFSIILNPRQKEIATLFYAEGRSSDRMNLLAKLLVNHPEPDLELQAVKGGKRWSL